MTRFSSKVSVALALLGLAACGAAPAPAPSQAANSAVPGDDLRRIVDRYWDERVSSGNPLSPQFMADMLADERPVLLGGLDSPRRLLCADTGVRCGNFMRQL